MWAQGRGVALLAPLVLETVGRSVLVVRVDNCGPVHDFLLKKKTDNLLY